MKPFFIGAILWSLTQVLFAQNLDTTLLNRLFQSFEKRNEAMGSIAIGMGDKMLYQNAIGISHVPQITPLKNTTETGFRIWSITKMFTATLIFQAIETGKIELTTRLNEYFPNIKNASNITIEQLLSHRSGIHDYTQNATAEPWDKNEKGSMPKRKLLQIIAGFEPDFEPGERFQYSNSNFVLLGYILEKIHQRSYADLLQENILNPLNLKSTYFGDGQPSVLKNECQAFEWKQNAWQLVEEAFLTNSEPAAAGGIISTPSDLVRFMQAIMDGQIISSKSYKQMTSINEGYGMGMHPVFSYEGGYGVGHTGGHIVSRSFLAHFPEADITIAYCTNGQHYRMEFLLDHVLRVVLDKSFGISISRFLLWLLTWGFLFVALLLLRNRIYPINLSYIGYSIMMVFWLGLLISWFLQGDFNPFQKMSFELEYFYSKSGNVMAGMEFFVSGLMLLFLWEARKVIQQKNLSYLPLLPLLLLPISMMGTALNPQPYPSFDVFANIIFLSGLSPILAIWLWRKHLNSQITRGAVMSLILIVSPLIAVALRPLIGHLIHDKMGLIQMLFFFGWNGWILLLSAIIRS